MGIAQMIKKKNSNWLLRSKLTTIVEKNWEHENRNWLISRTEVGGGGRFYLPPRPVLPPGQAPVSRASPTAPSTAAAAAAAAEALVALAAAEANASRAPARDRASSAPGLVRVLRWSVVPVAHISGSGPGPVVAGVLHPVPRVPGSVQRLFAVVPETRIRLTGSGMRPGPCSGSGVFASLSLSRVRLGGHVRGRVNRVRGPAGRQNLLHFFSAASGSADQLNSVDYGSRLKFFPELKFQFR